LVIARSGAALITVVPAVPELFSGVASSVAEVMVTVLVYSVPAGVPEGTLVTSVKLAVAPAANDGRVQVTGPVVPTAGVVQVQPAGDTRLTNVRLPGNPSETDTDVASFGPALPV
jgi:hypothetical protein